MSKTNVEQVLVALRKVIRATDLHSKYLAKTTGLTAPQLLLLNILYKSGQATVGQLANDMSLSQATVTTIIDRLVKRELVTRQRSEDDRRKVFIALTQDANTVVETAPDLLQEEFTQQFENLQQWEQSLLISSLQRIATMMDAQHIDAAPLLDIGTPDRTTNNQETGNTGNI